ncbi:MAG: aromatic acid exporter family protein [Cellulosilyticum sp.]|nr:FUSC family protein [Cellulosilyticum sp.]MEE1073574.1 aromatic acid exporter family protein [Cellulosilyticum sp.]
MPQITNIGLRTLKTALAVFLCLLISPSEPFFACMTVIFCIQNTVNDSIQAALTRSLGTLLGGILGLIFLCLCRYIQTLGLSFYLTKLITYLLISIGIIITIQCFNLLHRPSWIPIGCIVFLAVTTANADKAPLFYTVNRVVETFFGSFIALLVNRFITPPKTR